MVGVPNSEQQLYDNGIRGVINIKHVGRRPRERCVSNKRQSILPSTNPRIK